MNVMGSKSNYTGSSVAIKMLTKDGDMWPAMHSIISLRFGKTYILSNIFIIVDVEVLHSPLTSSTE